MSVPRGGEIVLLTGRSTGIYLILQTSQVARGSVGLGFIILVVHSFAVDCSLLKFQTDFHLGVFIPS